MGKGDAHLSGTTDDGHMCYIRSLQAHWFMYFCIFSNRCGIYRSNTKWKPTAKSVWCPLWQIPETKTSCWPFSCLSVWLVWLRLHNIMWFTYFIKFCVIHAVVMDINIMSQLISLLLLMFDPNNQCNFWSCCIPISGCRQVCHTQVALSPTLYLAWSMASSFSTLTPLLFFSTRFFHIFFSNLCFFLPFIFNSHTFHWRSPLSPPKHMFKASHSICLTILTIVSNYCLTSSYLFHDRHQCFCSK